MDANTQRLTARYASIIEDHERRNDCCGTYHQAWANFKEQVWTNRANASGFQLPSGNLTKDAREAVTAWAKAGEFIGQTDGW